MKDVLGALALVVYLLAAVGTEMLLAVLTEYCFGLLRGLLALLTYELDFIFVLGVRGVAVGAGDLLTGQAPQRAFGLLFALLTLDGHEGLFCSYLYLYYYSALS